MPVPPPFLFDPAGLGSLKDGFRAKDAGAQRPVMRQPPLSSRPQRPRSRLQLICWALGVGGYGALLFAAHGSRNADALHGVAIIWLLVFGALNAHLILERR